MEYAISLVFFLPYSKKNDFDKCTCKNSKKKRSVDRALAAGDIKKEEALLLDLLRLMRMHYDCIRQVHNVTHNFNSILNDATQANP